MVNLRYRWAKHMRGGKIGVVVHKFGGASLADGAAMRNAIGLVRAAGRPAAVVVSALEGVTDALSEAAGAVV